MSAFVFSPNSIDFHIFGLWLDGQSVSQASQQRDEEEIASLAELGLLDVDTADHFRVFEQLQPVLEEPKSVICLLELPQHVREKLSEQFYTFDSTVMREFLNRKFTARVRKDWLEEVSEITSVSLRSCVRQYDNLRRLFDAADEIGFQRSTNPIPMADQVAEEFHIPKSLMRSYEQILFLMCHRFNIKRNNKQVSIPLETYLACAKTMMTMGWCLKNIGSDTYSFEFDAALFARMRDFRNRVNVVDMWTADEEVLFDSAQTKKRFEQKFKPWFRALVACGTGKDLRDFFEDLSEAVSELVELRPELQSMFKLDAAAPPVEGGGAATTANSSSLLYLDHLVEVLNQAVSASLSPADFATWQMYIGVVWPCVTFLAEALE